MQLLKIKITEVITMQGHYQKQKIYYTHTPTGDIYRIQAVGYTQDTGEKRVIIRNLLDGKDWDLPWKDLSDVKLIDGKVQNIWERMPDGWFPKRHEELRYPGYTDDPREEVRDGYNVYGRKVQPTNNSSKPYYIGGRYSKFNR